MRADAAAQMGVSKLGLLLLLLVLAVSATRQQANHTGLAVDCELSGQYL